MANGFVVAKFHSHILHTSTKMKSVSLTSRRKYKTNSSSPASLKILNKILGKTLQNTLGVEVILKYIKDYPCFTTKPFFTECTGHRHQKLGPNAPHSKFHFYDSDRGGRFRDNLEIENKSTYTDIGSKMQTIEYNKVKTKFQKAHFTKCIVHRHQKPDSNASDPMYSNPLKGSATDQIEATYFSDKDNFAMEKSESKPAYIDIGLKVQIIQYDRVKQAKFIKPYFTKCRGHYRHKPNSNSSDSRFPLYSVPSKNPVTDLTKAIYLLNKDHLVIKISKNKTAYYGSNAQTTEFNKNKAEFQKVYFTKCIGHHHQNLASSASEPTYLNPLKDPATDQIGATYISDKDDLAMEKYENEPADIDTGSKIRRIEYNKVKAKFQSPYFTKRTERYYQNFGSNASEPMFSLSLSPIPDRNKAIHFSDQDSLTMKNTESRSVNIDIGSKVQRIEYNKVKAKYVENLPEPNYGLKLIERIHVIPRIPQPEERSDMIESQLKYNKVKPRYPKYVNLDSDSKDNQSTQL